MTAKDIEWGIISQLPSAKVKGVSSGFGTTPVDNYINQLNSQFTDLASYAATSSPASGDSTLQLKIDSSEVTWGALKSNLSSIIYNNTFSPLITMYVVTTTATPGVLTTVDSATLSNIQTNIQGKVAEGTVVQLISTASYLVTSTVEYALTMLPGYSLLTGQTATEAEIGAYFDALNYGDEISTQDLYSNIKTNVDGVDSIVIYLNLNPAANVTLTNVFGTLSDGASGALYFTPDDGYIFTLPATNSFVRL